MLDCDLIIHLKWSLKIYFKTHTPPPPKVLLAHVFLQLVIQSRLLTIFVFLSSLPVGHLSDAPRRRLVVTGNSARIQDETTENSAWFFNVLGV